MQLHEFLARVQQHGEMQSRDQAMQAVRATLETLSDRLTGQGAEHLAAQLPKAVKHFAHSGGAERFSAQEFIERIADKEGCETHEAERHAKAVMDTIGEAVDEGDFQHLFAQLPNSYHKLFGQPVRSH